MSFNRSDSYHNASDNGEFQISDCEKVMFTMEIVYSNLTD